MRSLSHTNTDNIELKTTLQKLPLNLRGDTVETDVTTRKDSSSLGHHRCSLSHDCKILNGEGGCASSGMQKWKGSFSTKKDNVKRRDSSPCVSIVDGQVG